MKKVLLTGASGFIGRYCLRKLLENGYAVHAVSRIELKSDNPNLHWHKADFLKNDEISTVISQVRPDHLLHLAWQATPGIFWSSTENIQWVAASLELLRCFHEQGGRRVVMAGTCAEYDWSYGYCTEGVTPLAPSTLYGTCKHSLQMALSSYSRQTGLSSAWGRVFFLYGPHEHNDRLVAAVIRASLKGDTVRCSQGDQIRDFLHIEDAADAFVAILDSEACGPINVASGRPVALKEVILRIATRLASKELVKFGAKPRAEDDPPVLFANVDRLSEEVGWVPKYELASGLDQTIDWWRKNNSGGEW